MQTLQPDMFDEFGFTYIAPRSVIPMRISFKMTENWLRFKTFRIVSSEDTAKSWSFRLTTPRSSSLSSTWTTTSIASLPMPVSHASFTPVSHDTFVQLSKLCLGFQRDLSKFVTNRVLFNIGWIRNLLLTCKHSGKPWNWSWDTLFLPVIIQQFPLWYGNGKHFMGRVL